MSKKLVEEDFVGAGFEKLDPDAVELSHPPKIAWGKIYREQWTDAERLEYAEKLAGSMNHAAKKIQDERDALGELCERKEAQLVQMSRDLAMNNRLLQSEITKMNAERQGMNEAYAKLNTELRELKRSLVA